MASSLAVVLFLFAQTQVFPEQDIQVEVLPRTVIETRLAGVSNSNAKRQANLKSLFEEAGCLGQHLVDQPVKRERIPNLECTLPGTTDSVIIVGAHFDYRGEGWGVADNWSGAALLPSLFQSLKAIPRKHTFKFVGFTEEEKGLIGSSFYARKLTRWQIARTRAMVNLDTLGLSATKVWLNRADSRLARLLQIVAQAQNLPLQSINMDQIGSTTDSESFRRRKIPAITIHSVTQDNRHILHSARDVENAVNRKDYYETYRLVSLYLAALDAQLD